MKKENEQFSPRANILIHLGEKLIKDEVIAIVELIKNSYDADAKNVYVFFNTKEKSIEILDDGHGMSKEVVVNYWLEPGNSQKEDSIKTNKRSKKYKRLPIGEKGIGRFGVHKLGHQLSMISKTIGKPEVSLFIDWRDFSKAKYLKDVEIKIEEKNGIKASFFKNRVGTRLIVSNLKFSLSLEFYKKISLAIKSLGSPYEGVDNFNIHLDTDEEKWKEKLGDDDPMDKALYRFSAKVKNGRVVHYVYEFVPPARLKLKARKLTLKDPKVKVAFDKIFDSENDVVPIDLNDYKIGDFTIDGHIFDLDRVLLKPLEINSKVMQSFLKNFGGVRVYRDRMRVYNYGEPGDDWLKLDSKRVNNPTKGLSNNILICAVNLDRQHSSDLVEKTNREGFIENKAFYYFRSAILHILNITQTYRLVDKSGTKQGQGRLSEPVLGSIGLLRTTIENKVSSKEVRDDLLKQVKGLEKEYNEIKTILIKSSNAGLSISTAIHEMEKVILEANHLVNAGKYDIKIKKIVVRLKELLDNYSRIIKSSGKKSFDLVEAVEQAIFNSEYRFSAHKVNIVKNYKLSQRINVHGQASLVIGALINLFDNSIFWLSRARDSGREITINISSDKKVAKISVSDNGLGFLISGEDAVKPFVTARDGMGLGLNIIYEILQSIGGELEIIEANNRRETPYDTGATVTMRLQKEGLHVK